MFVRKLEWPNIFKSLSILFILFYIAVCGFLYFRQSHFIYDPEQQIRATPALYHLPYQEVELPITTQSQKIEKIHGWWIPAAEKNAKTLLYLHGKGANMGKEAERVSQFHQLGLSVFLIDYRGFGKSEGEFPSEAQIYEDAEQAWQYLIQKLKLNPKHIFVYGHSLGGAIAIELALHHPQIAGLIIESSFTAMRDMAIRTDWWASYIPLDFLLTQKFDSRSKIQALAMPILFIHGTADTMIPYEMSEQLFAMTTARKKLLLIPQGDHDHNYKIGKAQYVEAIRAFVKP